MKNILSILVLCFLISNFAYSQKGKIKSPKQPKPIQQTKDPNLVSKTQIGSNSFTTTADKYSTTWTSGNLNENHIGPNNKEDNFEVLVKPGTYHLKVEIDKIGTPNGIKSGQLKIRIHGGFWCVTDGFEIFNHGVTTREVFAPGVLSTQDQAIGRFYFETKRAGNQTNVKYKITLVRVSTTLMTRFHGMPHKDALLLNRDIIADFSPKYQNYHKFSKNTAKVIVYKKSGRARSTIRIYTSDYMDKNQPKVLYSSIEFPQGGQITTKEVSINNVNGKYIHLEFENHSVAHFFKFRARIEQY